MRNIPEQGPLPPGVSPATWSLRHLGYINPSFRSEVPPQYIAFYAYEKKSQQAKAEEKRVARNQRRLEVIEKAAQEKKQTPSGKQTRTRRINNMQKLDGQQLYNDLKKYKNEHRGELKRAEDTKD